MMNIHQVVENGRHLETKIEEQEKKIEEQEKKIEEQETKIENLERKFGETNVVLYQLLGLLFNQSEKNNNLQHQSNGDQYRQLLEKNI